MNRTSDEHVSRTPDVRRRLSLLMWTTTATVVVFVANYLFFVRTTIGQELDDAALAGGELEPQGVITEAWDELDVISVASLAVACVAIGLIALARRRFALAFAALATIGIANVATQLLKRVVLPRPDLIGAGDLNSLPSGHATVAATVAVGLVMVTAPRWRSITALVTMLFPISIAVAVVTAGWHRPSDSIAAFCVVLAVATTTLAVAVALFGFDPGLVLPSWFRRSVLVIIGVVIALLGGLGLVGLVAVRSQLDSGPLGTRWESVAYASSSAGITATALVTMLALLVAMRGMAVGHGGWGGAGADTDDAPTASI
ncbi:phosphatase PAP2 family protein [Ilumatobacter sp.]|uniref:phosphatase PAP2 family protein n=1 Tax=Ilumatobacter sp. TaxID=1967498 RepID=UPI003AF69CC3